MRNGIVVLSMLLWSIASATAQVSVNIGIPDVSIGINVPVYPQLVLVPGYPVYYAPQMNANYFFYDGMYWVYQQDNWYASSWYNGPWGLVSDDVVPLFILRVPVRYYRRPPTYFRGWSPGAAPRWGDHWGNAWAQRRSGWDNWNRNSAPQAAPLPVYQRQYSGNRYPREDQQQVLQRQNYRYQPREATVQQYYQARQTQSGAKGAPAPSSALAPSRQGRQAMTQSRAPAPPEQRTAGRPASPPQSSATAARAQPPRSTATAAHAQPPRSTATAARAQPPRPESANTRRPVTAQNHPQQKGPAQVQEQHAKQGPAARPAAQPPRQAVAQRAQPAAKSQGQEKAPQGKGAAQEPKQDQKKGPENGG